MQNCFVISFVLILKLNVIVSVLIGGNFDQVRDWSRSVPYVN